MKGRPPESHPCERRPLSYLRIHGAFLSYGGGSRVRRAQKRCLTAGTTERCPPAELKQPPLSAGECAFEVHRLQSVRPILQRCSIRLRGLLIGAENGTSASRMKFQPPFPRAVNALLPTNMDYISERSTGYERGMFAYQHEDLLCLRCAQAQGRCSGTKERLAKRVSG
jgi:hypothetical protein